MLSAQSYTLQVCTEHSKDDGVKSGVGSTSFPRAALTLPALGWEGAQQTEVTVVSHRSLGGGSQS